MESALFAIVMKFYSTGGDNTGAYCIRANSTGAAADSTGADSTGADSTGADSTGADSTGAHSTGAYCIACL